MDVRDRLRLKDRIERDNAEAIRRFVANEKAAAPAKETAAS